MAYAPNYDCANFCYWMLNLSWQRLTGPQTVLVNTVYTAALAQTTVTDQQWKDFTMISAWRSKYYESWGKYASYYNSLCQSWLNNLPSTPPAWYTALINQFFQDLIDAGISSELDRLWILAGPSEGVALVSLINPASAPCTNVNSTTFTPYYGYKGNASNMRINTNYNLATDSVMYTLNSASFGAYSRTQYATASNEVIMGCGNGLQLSYIQPNYTGNILFSTVNSAYAGTTPPYVTTQGLHVAQRTSATSQTNWRSGVSLGSAVTNSVGLYNGNMSLLAYNSSFYSRLEISMAFTGSGAFSQATFYNIVQALMTRLGCQV